MKKWLILVVLLVLVLGVSGFVMNKRGTSLTDSPTTTNPELAATENAESMSLKTLMAKGVQQECTYADTEAKSSGTVYVGKDAVRGDFTSNANGTVTMSHMISDATTIYMWVDGQTQGFKSGKAALENLSGNAQVKQNVDINKEVNYSCKPWTTDTSKLEVPKDVTFTDFSAMIPATSTQTTASAAPNSAQCAACDGLDETTKAQCRTALHCP